MVDAAGRRGVENGMPRVGRLVQARTDCQPLDFPASPVVPGASCVLALRRGLTVEEFLELLR